MTLELLKLVLTVIAGGAGCLLIGWLVALSIVTCPPIFRSRPKRNKRI